LKKFLIFLATISLIDVTNVQITMIILIHIVFLVYAIWIRAYASTFIYYAKNVAEFSVIISFTLSLYSHGIYKKFDEADTDIT
jgi:hypothetical protein